MSVLYWKKIEGHSMPTIPQAPLMWSLCSWVTTKGGHVVCRKAELRHAFEASRGEQSVIDHNEPCEPLDECAVAFRATARGYEGAGET